MKLNIEYEAGEFREAIEYIMTKYAVDNGGKIILDIDVATQIEILPEVVSTILEEGQPKKPQEESSPKKRRGRPSKKDTPSEELKSEKVITSEEHNPEKSEKDIPKIEGKTHEEAEEIAENSISGGPVQEESEGITPAELVPGDMDWLK